MTRAEARAWIREHWAIFIRMSEPPADKSWRLPVPPLVQAMWSQECRRIATQIDGRTALSHLDSDAKERS